MDFLDRGRMIADFRQGGILACAKNVLKIFVQTSVSWSEHALSSLPGTPSGPAAFLWFTALSTCLTLCCYTARGFMLLSDGISVFLTPGKELI